MSRKYITIRTDEGKELLFTFPFDVFHKAMFEVVQGIRHGDADRWNRPYIGAKCVGAGFVTPDGVCQGHSESLNVSARIEADTKLLAMGGASA